MNNVIILKVNENNSEEIKLEKFNINSIYTHEKINSLFKNFDTLSFIDLIMNYDELSKRGYNKIFSQSKFAFNVVDAVFPIYNDCSSFDTHNEHFKKVKKHENYHFWLNYLCFDIFFERFISSSWSNK